MDWRLALPGIIDLLAGISYYFTGLLIGLREARWYGSRVLAIALPIVCSSLAIGVPEFWQALPVVGLGALISATAAWGSFRTGGTYRPQLRVAKAALGLSVLLGICLVGIVVIATLTALFTQQIRIYKYTSYTIDNEGKVLRVVQEGQTILSITDLSGNALQQYAGITDATALSERTNGVASAALMLHSSRAYLRDSYRSNLRFFLPIYDRFDRDPRFQWYYIHGKRYLIGFDAKGARRIGAIGPDGFVPDDAGAPRKFEGEFHFGPFFGGYQTILTFSSGVYALDLTRRRIERLFTSPSGETIVAAAEATGGQPPPGQPVSRRILESPFLLVGTDDSLHVQPRNSAGNRPPMSTPIAHDALRYGQVTVSTVPQKPDYLVRYSPSWDIGIERTRMPEYLATVSPEGNVLSEIELPPIPIEAPKEGLTQSFLGGLAAPLAGIFTATIIESFSRQHEFRNLFHDRESLAVLSAAALSALVCAAVTFYIARRYAFSSRRRIGWTAGNFLLGPAGLLTLLCLQEWPAREPCPTCARKRVVDRDNCEHCGAPFPPPAPEGTEIFET